MQPVRVLIALLIVFLSFDAFAWMPNNFKAWIERGNNKRHENLRQEFASYANYYVAAKGYQFGTGAKQQFEHDFAVRAADAILRIKMPKDVERAKKKISENFRLLINKMIEEAEKDPSYSRQYPWVVGEITLYRALRLFCPPPLWPICR